MRIDFIALIPAYNEEAVIEATLRSLFKAGMPKEKIIVINDGSRDRTAEIASSLGVVVFDNPRNLGKAGSVTRSLRIIFSDPRHKDLTHICFLDADTLVDPLYFQMVRKHLSLDIKKCEKSLFKHKKPISILCGRAKSIPYNYLTAFRAYEYWIAHAINKPAQSLLRSIIVAPGCASTYSISALKKVVWSDDTVTEDMDATIQVVKFGGRVVFERSAVVYTQDPNCIKDYVGQLVRRWYVGNWQVMRKHKLLWGGLFSPVHWEYRIIITETFAYCGGLLYTIFWNPTMLLWALLTISGTTMVFATVASVQERRVDILKYSPIFPFILILNVFLFMITFWNTLIWKRTVKKWYAPRRYTS